MPEGNNGVRGLETRQVVDSRDPSGQANTPARQLGMVGVSAPRGGSTAGVTAGSRAMLEVWKMGGAKLDGYLKKKQAEDTVKGEMLKAQGKSIEDAEKEGYNRNVLKGMQVMKIKTGYSQWMAKMNHDATGAHATMDPDEYRATVLEPQFKEALDGLDPNDDISRQLYTEMGKSGFSKLVEKQAAANTMHLEKDGVSALSNMMYADAHTGDIETVQDTVNDYEAITAGMSDSSRKKALMDAMIPHLNEGNFLLYDAFGGERGLRERNFSPAQIESVKNAVESAQVVREQSMDGEFMAAVDEIKLLTKEGRIGPQEAKERAEGLQEQYRLSEDFVRTIVRDVRDNALDDKIEDRQLEIMHDPDYVQAMSQLSIMAHMQGNSKDVTNATLAIAENFNLPRNMVVDNLEKIQAAQANKERVVKQSIDAETAKFTKQKEKEIKAVSALNSGSLHTQDAETQQMAMQLKKQQIHMEVQAKGGPEDEQVLEMARKHVAFLRETPVIDAEVQNNFKLIGQSSPIGEDGTLRPEHEQAHQYITIMREAGLSERTMRKYAGDSYDYLTIASAISEGAIDPKTALATAWEQVEIPKDERPVPKTNVNEAVKGWDDIKEDYFDDIEPSIISSMLGAESDAKYDEILTGQVKEAARNSEAMDSWAKDRIQLYAKTYPNMKQKGVMDLVKKDLSRWEYVMGTMVPPRGGRTVSEAMGLDKTPGALNTNSAMLMYMSDNADLLFPEGSDTRGGWEKFKSKIGDGLEQAIFNPTAMYMGVEAHTLALLPSEKAQQLRNDIKMVDVLPMANGNLLVTLYNDDAREEPSGTPVIIPAKDVGDWYKTKTKDNQYNKHLPRR